MLSQYMVFQCGSNKDPLHFTAAVSTQYITYLKSKNLRFVIHMQLSYICHCKGEPIMYTQQRASSSDQKIYCIFFLIINAVQQWVEESYLDFLQLSFHFEAFIFIFFNVTTATFSDIFPNHVFSVEGHLNPGLFNPRVFNHELFNPRLFNHELFNPLHCK